MNKIQELTDEFFRASVVTDMPVDTSRAVIPEPRSASQIIADEVRYWSSITSLNLRAELRAEIDKVEPELDAIRSARAAMDYQRKALERECAEVSNARRLLNYELRDMRAERDQMRQLYRAYAVGLCTPSRNLITGR